MPWPYRSKGRISNGNSDHDDQLEVGVGSLMLSSDENNSDNSNSNDRRAVSLDISRPLPGSLTALTPSNAAYDGNNTALKARRSSFPRLAMPSWRSSSSTSTAASASATTTNAPNHSRNGTVSSSASIRSTRSSIFTGRQSLDDVEETGVELQEGHGTPFTASGLKGGFQCLNTTPSSSASSSMSASSASTSISSKKSSTSSGLFSVFTSSSSKSGSSQTSDEYSLDIELPSTGPPPTPATPATPENYDAINSDLSKRYGVPTDNRGVPETTDSGFSDFGPHSIVEEEETRRLSPVLTAALQGKNSNSSRSNKGGISTQYDEDDGDTDAKDNGSNVTIPKKARSRGWFSFQSSSSNSSSTPTSSASKADNTPSTASEGLPTPRQERENPMSAPAVSPENIVSSNSAIHASRASTTEQTNIPKNQQQQLSPPSIGKKTKQSTSSKGINIIRSAGRKRGDSEVSMKEMTNFS